MSTTATADAPESATTVSVGYGIAIALSILVLISTIMLASYACVRIQTGTTTNIHRNHGLSRAASGGVDDGGGGSSGRRQANSNSLFHSTAISTLPGPTVVKLGLQQRPMIESCTEMILGESKRLPGPNSGPCSICLGEYRPKEAIRCMPDCNHCFHSGCIDQWLRMSPTCPLCRSSPAASSGVTPVGTPLSELVPLAFVR